MQARVDEASFTPFKEFDCCSADIDETPIADELPEDYVLRMAVEKASALKNERGVIIGSDTVVVLSGNILQKPVSVEDARGMLGALVVKLIK